MATVTATTPDIGTTITTSLLEIVSWIGSVLGIARKAGASSVALGINVSNTWMRDLYMK
jgi:hypothetical protein